MIWGEQHGNEALRAGGKIIPCLHMVIVCDHESKLLCSYWTKNVYDGSYAKDAIVVT